MKAADNVIFGFETDFAGTLRCIPMAVRFKLDQSGVKLSLRQWSRFNRAERAELLDRSCDTAADIEAYRTYLVDLITTRAGQPAEYVAVGTTPEWSDGGLVPARIVEWAKGIGVVPPSSAQWTGLTPLQRFALFKLTRPGHDNDNFLPAMREFGLTS